MLNTRMVRLGIIGCGGVTEFRHLPALRQVHGVEISALSDLDTARLERIAARFGVAGRYRDYRELIESGRVEAVAVCVPPQLHAGVARAALEAGKHVFIEKPLALSLEECDALTECVANNSALKVMVGFNMRWHRLVRAARERIRRGELGEIKLARTLFTSGVRLREDFAGWRRQHESGGGALFELGMHHFDVLRFLLEEEVLEVYASSHAADETAIIAARMESGAQVVSAFSEGTGENHAIEVYGEKGWLRVSCYRADGLEQFGAGEYSGAMTTRLRGLTRTLLSVPRMIRQARRGGDYVASYVEEWRHFINAITNDSPIASSTVDGRRALEIALAAREAISTKRAIRLRQSARTEATANVRRPHEAATF